MHGFEFLATLVVGRQTQELMRAFSCRLGGLEAWLGMLWGGTGWGVGGRQIPMRGVGPGWVARRQPVALGATAFRWA